MMTIPLLISFIITVSLSLLITPQVIRFAYRIGATDQPGGRKIHSTVKPRLGGLSVFLSIFLSLIVSFLLFPFLFEGIREYTTEIYLITASLFIIFSLGFWDDLTPLKPGLKFGVQLIIAALVYYAGFKISNITNPLGDGVINVEIIDFPLTLLWIVGITNAFNLIDGLDGLASGVAAIASISIFTVSILSGEIWSSLFAIILAGSLIGFLKYNFNPARIFLGDSGSLLIGFCLALLSIQSTTKISTGFALLFPMLVLILPITDTLVSMARRFLGSYLTERGENTESLLHKLHHMFTPDKSHIHHQLISLGLSHRNTVLVLYVVSIFFAAGAFAISQINNIEKSVVIALLFGFALLAGVKQLRYREIAIFNNGLMLPIYERWILNRTIFLSLIDLCFIAFSYSLSYYLIRSNNPAAFDFHIFDQLLILILAVQLSIFWLTGLYREKIKQLGIGNALGITASVIYAVSGTALVLTMFFEALDFSLIVQFLIFDFYFLLTCTLGIRITYQALSFWFNRHKITGENVLIYGANENGTMLLHKINNSSDSPFKVIGFLDDDRELEGKVIYGYPIFGGHWKLSKTLAHQKVDSILLCQPNIKPENFNRLKRMAESKNIKIKHLQIRLKNIKTGSLEEQEIVAGQKMSSAFIETEVSKL